jgi:hypothetical protein
MGRYGGLNEHKRDPKERARKTKQNSTQVKSWLAVKDSIILQSSTISALKELATSEPKMRRNNNTYDEVILMLIRTYRQLQKKQ